LRPPRGAAPDSWSKNVIGLSPSIPNLAETFVTSYCATLMRRAVTIMRSQSSSQAD
jgi:hypothetical protein